MKSCAALLMVILMSACGTRKQKEALAFESLGWPVECSEGYGKGVSAPFCGVADGILVSAGGANFPDIPAAEGGTKCFYSDIFLLKSDGWAFAGKLPSPMAYGGSVNVNGRLIGIGGNDGTGTVADVFCFNPEGETVETVSMTPLPIPLEQAGYAFEGNDIYVAGGMTDGGINDKVYAGKVRGTEISWSEVAEMPEPMVQPVAFCSKGILYIWGGFDPAAKTVSDRGWKLIDGKWSLVAGSPDGETLTGASAGVLDDGRLVVIGGVNDEVFNWGLSVRPEERHEYMTLVPEEYRFNRKLRIFDPEEDSWSICGEADALALAGAGVVADNDGIFVIGGEIKPGVRRPQTWEIELQ